MAAAYFDYNATTPVASEVVAMVSATMTESWANPSSLHKLGLKAAKVISVARRQVADMLDGDPSGVIFTSGGTEANNMVLHSAVESYKKQWTHSVQPPPLPHVIISNVEHDSISKAAHNFLHEGIITLSEVAVNPDTRTVEPPAVLDLLTPNTCLVSIMLANNETGNIMPIREIFGAVLSWQEARRRSTPPNNRILLHTDAAQAIGKVPVSVRQLAGVNYITVVGHKFYGPRIGALYVNDPAEDPIETPVFPMFLGGNQERGLRPGTENTPMIAGLGAACQLVTKNLTAYAAHMADMRELFSDTLRKELDKISLTFVQNGGGGFGALPNTLNVSLVGDKFPGADILKLAPNFLASLGAACHSSQQFRASKVLLSFGVPESQAVNAIRVSVGRETTRDEVRQGVADICQAAKQLMFKQQPLNNAGGMAGR